MTIQAFEPSKTNSFHPSIMKGAIAMDADDFKSEKAPADAAPASPQEKEADTQYEEAKAWRDRTEAHAPADAALLQELDEEGLVNAYRFYLADLRLAEKWREELVSQFRDEAKTDQWNAESVEWLESLSGDDLLSARNLWRTGERLMTEREAKESEPQSSGEFATEGASADPQQDPHIAWFDEWKTLRPTVCLSCDPCCIT